MFEGRVRTKKQTAVLRAAGKRGNQMNRRIYRMCLAAVLIIAVAGGVFYYMTLNEKQAGIEKGTFVEKIDRKSVV